MIQRSESGEPIILTCHGFILDVQTDQKAPPVDRLAEKIADALMHVEGCGQVNVGYLGEMDPEDLELEFRAYLAHKHNATPIEVVK